MGYRRFCTVYWLGVRRLMLLHSAFCFFGVNVVVFILLSAFMMCLELWIEKVFPITCFAHYRGVCAW